MNDITFAVRQLRRSPGFTLVAAITLAFGIGANSAIFALVDAVLLRPLPFRDPDRLVMVWERSELSAEGRGPSGNLLLWNERNSTFDLMAGFVPTIGSMVMSGADGTSDTIPRQWATAGFFEVLGVKAIAGRTFLASDDKLGKDLVVLSEAFWRTRFNADPSLIGREIRLDGSLFTVVGVVPEDFQFMGRSSMWALDRRRGRSAIIGRLKADVTLEAASSDMAAVAAGLAREFPNSNRGRGVLLEPMHEALIGSELRLTSMLFLGVVGFVLLICCANVASLLLARATVRTRELAIRSALGAGRGRVIRQLLTESLVLSTIGGVLGTVVGAMILGTAPSLIPAGLLPSVVTLAFGVRVAAFCAAASILVGLLFGLAPAWQATDFSTARALVSDSRTATGRGGTIRALLVVGEVATAVCLLFGAGLLLRTLLAVESVDRGYRAERVLTMIVDPLGSRYPTDESLLRFLADVEQEVRALPGVQSVGWASTLPLGFSYAGSSSFEIVGGPPPEPNKPPSADYQIVSPTYFTTLDLPVLAGRAFSALDAADRAPVCIVNEALARGYFQGKSPVGQRIAFRQAASAPPVVREIVGVARQVKGRPDETEALVQIYVPLAQEPLGDIYMLVRPSSGRAEALTPSVRAAIGRIDKEQLVSVRSVMTLDDVAREATARHRFRAVMVVTFAGLALLLAMVGVFGVLAYSVQQRSREFGVRLALGASLNDVLRLVLWNAVRLIAAGAVLGLAVAAVLGRLLGTVLFGVQPLDPLTFVSVTAVVAFTAAVATAAPAWRAARIDPAVALRSQ